MQKIILNYEQSKIYDERTKAEGLLRNGATDFFKGKWLSSMGKAEFDSWLASQPKQKTITCKAHGDYVAHYKTASRLGGMIVYSSCPKCIERAEEIKREIINNEPDRLRQEAEDMLEVGLLASGADASYMQARKGGIDFSRGVFSNLSGFFGAQDSLVLLGACGIGKSFFAYALVEKYLREKKEAKVIKARDLVSDFKSTLLDSGFSRTNDFKNVIDRVRGLDLIIIDEIDDALHDSTAIRELINYTDSNGIRVVIIGNCSAKDLDIGVGDKTASRLKKFISIDFGNKIPDLRTA